MRKAPSKLPGRLFAAAMLALMTVPLPARDKDSFLGNVPAPPPEPNPLVIDVPRGGPVWITLSAYSLTSPIIRFRIWRKPKGGQIGSPQNATADTAVVKYTPPAGAGPGEDSFAYEVQSEAGVSAPADVRIHITDKDPVLIAPDELDFGEVLPGQGARRTLALENIGGGLAEGIVRVPEGWSVEGNPAYRLGAGAKQSFIIDFNPKEEREYTGDVQYTGEAERATDLVGKEVAPIAAPAGVVELTQAGNIRLGTFQVQNRMDHAVALRVTSDPALEVAPTVNVPATGTADVLVQTKAGEEGEIYGRVTIEGAGEKLIVPTHAAPLRAMSQSTPRGAPAHTPAASPTAPAARPVSMPAIPSAGATMAEASLPEETEPAATPEPATPRPPLQVDRIGLDEERVTCDFKGLPQALSYRLEAQTVELDARGRPEPKWIPLPDAPVALNGTAVQIDLKHLRPSSLYVVRLVGLDDGGRVVAMSATGEVWTATAQKAGRPVWLAPVLAALAAMAAWWWRTRRSTR